MNPQHKTAEQEESLDLMQLFASLRRRWVYISLGVVLGGSYGVLRTAQSTPVWQGSFQIVIAEKNGGAGSVGGLGGNMLTTLAGFSKGGAKTELATQVKILESPSILKTVFDNVKARRERSGVNLKGYKFSDWASSLNVAAEKGTTILRITYSDTQRDQIIPTLNDISSIYQSYSNRDRNESLSNSIGYAEQQAEKYKKLADSSFRALNAYSMTYGIATTRTGGGSAGTGIDTSKLVGSGNNGSAPAVDIKNQTTGLLPQVGALDQLARVNQELIRLRQTFTEKDPSIISLENERKALRLYLESSAIGNIAYAGKAALSKKEAQNVLLKYKELETQAMRDQSTLDTMENTLLSLRLEQSRETKPWELISTPTVSDTPISPQPSKNLIYGLVGGLVIGTFSALFADRASGRIFNSEELSRNLPYPLIGVLTCEEKLKISDFILLLQERLACNKSLTLISLGSFNTQTSNILLNAFKNCGFNNVKISSSIADARSSEQTLLIAESGAAKRSDIQLYISELSLLNSNIIGLIWFDKAS